MDWSSTIPVQYLNISDNFLFAFIHYIYNYDFMFWWILDL